MVLVSCCLYLSTARIARPMFHKVSSLGYFVTAVDNEPRKVREKKVPGKDYISNKIHRLLSS